MRGLAITLDKKRYTNYYPLSGRLELKDNPTVMKWLTPRVFQRIRLLMGVNKWTG